MIRNGGNGALSGKTGSFIVRHSIESTLLLPGHIPHTFCQPDLQKYQHSKGWGCCNSIQVEAVFDRPDDTKDQNDQSDVEEDVKQDFLDHFNKPSCRAHI